MSKEITVKDLDIFVSATYSKKLEYEYRVKTTTHNILSLDKVSGKRIWFHGHETPYSTYEGEKALKEIIGQQAFAPDNNNIPLEIKVAVAWKESKLKIPSSGSAYDANLVVSDILKKSSHVEAVEIHKSTNTPGIITWNAARLVNSLRKKIYKDGLKPVESEYPINEYVGVWCNLDHLIGLKFSGKIWQDLDPLIMAINRFNTEEERLAAYNVTV